MKKTIQEIIKNDCLIDALREFEIGEGQGLTNQEIEESLGPNHPAVKKAKESEEFAHSAGDFTRSSEYWLDAYSALIKESPDFYEGYLFEVKNEKIIKIIEM